MSIKYLNRFYELLKMLICDRNDTGAKYCKVKVDRLNTANQRLPYLQAEAGGKPVSMVGRKQNFGQRMMAL